MIRTTLSLTAAAALASSLLAASASAQNLPPPGNVNPGSMNSGAEQTGAPNQPRSSGYVWPYYSMAPGYDTPGYSPYYGGQLEMPRGAPVYGGGYWD